MENLKRLSQLYGVSVDSLLDEDLVENNEIEGEKKNIPLEIKPMKSRLKREKYWAIVGCIMATIIILIILLGALVPRSRDQDQVVPMEEMCTGPDDCYTEGTFTIK